jgi:hypothetical protein
VREHVVGEYFWSEDRDLAGKFPFENERLEVLTGDASENEA